MSRGRRLFMRVLAAAVGASLGTLGVLLTPTIVHPSLHPRDDVRPVLTSPRTGPTPHHLPRASSRHLTLLAWTPGGLPSGTERVVRRTPGVTAATTVNAGLQWLRRVDASDGTKLFSARDDYLIPLEVAFVDPHEYAAFMPSPDRQTTLALSPGNTLLARTAARLRGGGAGLDLWFGPRSAHVVGVVSDDATNGYEALASGRPPRRWRGSQRFVLMRVHRGRRGAVERAIEALLPAGQPLRVRAQGETPFLRYGDSVLPQMFLKARFGEFAARPQPLGSLALDPSWTKVNLRSGHVPLLGRVTCNRALFPQLRKALSAVASSGLGYLVNKDDYGGCYAPKFVSRDSSNGVSHHSWGVAIDLNSGANPFGTEPTQDLRLVRTMEAWGFTWGGRWLTPDGMHFEWARFPVGKS